MLRALRFTAKLHFTLAAETAKPIAKLNHLLIQVSSSRLFDEMTKLYQCGEAITAQALLIQYDLFSQLFPQTHALMNSDYPVHALIGLAMESTDKRIQEGKPVTPAFIFAILLWFPLQVCIKEIQERSELPPLSVLEAAMSQVLHQQSQIIMIPKRFSQIIREIWLLQYRFSKRTGKRAFHVLEHTRFRAGYDFLALRALAGDESLELAQWWTTFQDLSEEEQLAMIAALPTASQTHSKKSDSEKTES